MFLNVTDNSSDENLDAAVFQTSLSSQDIAERLVTSLPVPITVPGSAKETKLGSMIYYRDKDTGVIILKSIFPFGGEIYRDKNGIQFNKDSWRKGLLGLGLARQIEYKTLSILAQRWGTDVGVYTDIITSDLRWAQLKKIGFEEGITLGHYLRLLAVNNKAN